MGLLIKVSRKPRSVNCWGRRGFFLKHRQIFDRQICFHTGKFLRDFRKSGRPWWANNGKEFPTWARAMQIIGSFTPNSAAAERVFSMLKQMFGDQQMTALADMIQAALMLKYNGRKVG